MDAITSVVSKFVSEHERPNIRGVLSLMTSSSYPNFYVCSYVISPHKLLVPAVHSSRLEDKSGNEGVKT